jgi:hypothetical protein
MDLRREQVVVDKSPMNLVIAPPDGLGPMPAVGCDPTSVRRG